MARIIKGRQMTARYYKGREVLKEYKGGRLVYEKSSSIPDYLCFTALEAGQFTLTIPAAVTPTYLSYIEWSKDGRTWNHRDNSSDIETIDVQVAQGDKVYWRGSGQSMSYSASSGYTSGFSSTGNFAISGHLVSILKGDNFENTSFANAAFARLFEHCDYLTSAEDLVLPSFTTTTYVFASMFLRCTALVSAPELPPVTTLTTGCYYQMFFGCSSLTHVKCLATDISATNCLYNWLNGVSSTGTFIQAEGVEWTRGASGIPTGWLAYDEGEEIPNDYTMCDYIYNTSSSQGSENLGFVFGTRSYSLETKFKQDEISNAMVCGSSTGDGRIWIYNYANVNKFAISILPVGASQVIIYPFQPVDTDVHIIKYIGDGDDQYYYHNGTMVGHGTRTDFTDACPSNLYIFGRPANQYKGRIYYLKVWKTATEEVICDLIPCSRNSDGAAGFWDTAQKQFFTSTYWTAHFDNE